MISCDGGKYSTLFMTWRDACDCIMILTTTCSRTIVVYRGENNTYSANANKIQETKHNVALLGNTIVFSKL